MDETRSANPDPQPLPWRAVAQLVFFAFWAAFILFRCAIVIHRGYFRGGNQANGPMVIASQQPLMFWGYLAFWAAIAVIVLLWAIRRFRQT